jgi:hypothetical protein
LCINIFTISVQHGDVAVTSPVHRLADELLGLLPSLANDEAMISLSDTIPGIDGIEPPSLIHFGSDFVLTENEIQNPLEEFDSLATVVVGGGVGGGVGGEEGGAAARASAAAGGMPPVRLGPQSSHDELNSVRRVAFFSLMN